MDANQENQTGSLDVGIPQAAGDEGQKPIAHSPSIEASAEGDSGIPQQGAGVRAGDGAQRKAVRGGHEHPRAKARHKIRASGKRKAHRGASLSRATKRPAMRRALLDGVQPGRSSLDSPAPQPSAGAGLAGAAGGVERPRSYVRVAKAIVRVKLDGIEYRVTMTKDALKVHKMHARYTSTIPLDRLIDQMVVGQGRLL